MKIVQMTVALVAFLGLVACETETEIMMGDETMIEDGDVMMDDADAIMKDGEEMMDKHS